MQHLHKARGEAQPVGFLKIYFNSARTLLEWERMSRRIQKRLERALLVLPFQPSIVDC